MGALIIKAAPPEVAQRLALDRAHEALQERAKAAAEVAMAAAAVAPAPGHAAAAEVAKASAAAPDPSQLPGPSGIPPPPDRTLPGGPFAPGTEGAQTPWERQYGRQRLQNLELVSD